MQVGEYYFFKCLFFYVFGGLPLHTYRRGLAFLWLVEDCSGLEGCGRPDCLRLNFRTPLLSGFAAICVFDKLAGT